MVLKLTETVLTNLSFGHYDRIDLFLWSLKKISLQVKKQVKSRCETLKGARCVKNRWEPRWPSLVCLP